MIIPKGSSAAGPPCGPEPNADSAVCTAFDLRDVAKQATDMGNAARLVCEHGKDIRFCVPTGKWLIWDETRWKPDDSLEIMTRAKTTVLSFCEGAEEDDYYRKQKILQWAIRSQSQRSLNAMVELAKSDIAIKPGDLDKDRFLFNIQNGTIDLKSGVSNPHRREDYITKIAPVRFDQNATCPLWYAFLSRILNGSEPLHRYLQKIAGVCLTGDVREQVLPIFHGPGANGKSVFLETLAGMMGDYACYAPAGLLVQTGNQEHPTELADLMGRRLVIASETEEGHRLKIQRVKQLTGDIRLKARYMRQDYFEFDQTHKLILVCNNKPIIPESTNAIWRRVKLVPFEVVIPAEERDENLIEKLRAEWPGILNWAIAGCLMWQKEGLDAPEQVREATKEYESEQDVLGAFIEDCCVMSADALVSRADIFAEYQKWVESNHERKILDRNSFYERLRKLPGVSEAMKKFQHKPVRGFTGIGLLARSQQVAG